jgi:D-alanyl-lipoteichoic acid acyltransferase DltB (MBOAT superfamily)
MLFNSLQFLVFFMVVTLLFFRLKTQRQRVWMLLLASCYFYMSFVPVYILILGFTIVIDYFAGIQIEKANGRARKNWLILSIIANVGILAYFKYFNFFLDNLNIGLRFIDSTTSLHFLEIILPIGLSFHTFQAMSYTIEVYRGKQPAERDFVTYALYVMFYPQLVAGPIERPQNVLPQLHQYTTYNADNVREGIARMLWGFFKKVVIADRLAMAVDHCFANYTHLSSTALFTGAVFYSFQIYCDFSGYSDIGIGAARVMNIKLMENFNQPYISRNISEFWGRWHISLSTWFRDYVYIPLGGNRHGEAVRKRNALSVFLLSGLWHGANWTFIIWGALHGLMTTFFPGKYKHKTDKQYFNPTVLFWVIVNFIVVTIFWIFFRASNSTQALAYIKRTISIQSGNSFIGINGYETLLSILLIGVMMWRENRFPHHSMSKRRFPLYMAALLLVCYVLGVYGENQFIYFQF